MFINNIKVSNFRSIVNCDLDLQPSTVLVGDNDIGKSNLLRALNLFFNGGLDWDADYSKLAIPRLRRAPEISIQVTFKAPNTFKSNASTSPDYTWKRSWRRDGTMTEKFPEIPERSKIAAWARRLKLRYIPALRGREYLTELLTEIHDVLDRTVSKELKTAGDNFIGSIQSHTALIEKDVLRILQLETKIQFPATLRELFSKLDFETNSGAFKVAMRHRGDGIQNRVIPQILSFLAAQERTSKVPGTIRRDTVLAYEEPENCCELTSQMKLAEQITAIANDTQVILTTHSPALYSLGFKKNSVAYLASRDSSGQTIYSSIESAESLDEKLGLIHFVGPYIEKARQDQTKLRKTIEDLERTSFTDCLVVEGETDVTILKALAARFGINLPNIVAKNGTPGVQDFVTAAWFLNSHRVFAIVDGDDAGKIAIEQVANVVGSKRRKVAIEKLKHRGHKDFLPIVIETMFPIEFWKHALKKGWLEERKALKDLVDKKNRDRGKSTDQWLRELKASDPSLELFMRYEVIAGEKSKFAQFVRNSAPKLAEDDIPDLLALLRRAATHLAGPSE